MAFVRTDIPQTIGENEIKAGYPAVLGFIDTENPGCNLVFKQAISSWTQLVALLGWITHLGNTNVVLEEYVDMMWNKDSPYYDKEEPEAPLEHAEEMYARAFRSQLGLEKKWHRGRIKIELLAEPTWDCEVSAWYMGHMDMVKFYGMTIYDSKYLEGGTHPSGDPRITGF